MVEDGVVGRADVVGRGNRVDLDGRGVSRRDAVAGVDIVAGSLLVRDLDGVWVDVEAAVEGTNLGAGLPEGVVKTFRRTCGLPGGVVDVRFALFP